MRAYFDQKKHTKRQHLKEKEENLMNEFTLQVRTAAMAIIYCWANICQFVSLKTYPKLLEFAGLLGFLIIYGIGCIVAAIFILFVLKETAGKSIDDVGVDAKAKDTANADDTSTRVWYATNF